jgi:prepilin-type N-terminal cleavage/methylation domain-containing protein
MKNQKGFTLIEIMSVMIILGIIITFGVVKFVRVDHTAELRGLEMGLMEINTREKLEWTNLKISFTSYDSDEEMDTALIEKVDLNMPDYKWNGTELSLGGTSISLERIPATRKHPAIWRKLNE